MEKKHTVFVSATYTDLVEERKEVMQALLECDCIPCGMEMFPAADEDQWSFIKSVIDDCDYYLLVIGGRYGSKNSDGIGYTELEYRYAKEKEKPIIAFPHANREKLPSEKCSKTATDIKKLDKFISSVQENRLIKHWSSAKELAHCVN